MTILNLSFIVKDSFAEVDSGENNANKSVMNSEWTYKEESSVSEIDQLELLLN